MDEDPVGIACIKGGNDKWLAPYGETDVAQERLIQNRVNGFAIIFSTARLTAHGIPFVLFKLSQCRTSKAIDEVDTMTAIPAATRKVEYEFPGIDYLQAGILEPALCFRTALS